MTSTRSSNHKLAFANFELGPVGLFSMGRSDRYYMLIYSIEMGVSAKFFDVHSATRVMHSLRQRNPFPGAEYFYIHGVPNSALSIQISPDGREEEIWKILSSITNKAVKYTYDIKFVGKFRTV